MNKRLIILLIVLIGAMAAIWFWGSQDAENKQQPANNEQITSNMVLFYGAECPHCKDLDKTIEELKIKDKVKFDNLETWHNKQNSQLLIEKAEECGVAREEIGVPFFYGEGKCYIGTPEIEAYLKQKAGIN